MVAVCLECITDVKCILNLNRRLLTPALVAHSGKTYHVSECQVAIWRRGTFTKREQQLYFLACYKATGGFWIQVISPRRFYNYSVTVESWHVVCKCAIPPDLTFKYVTGSHCTGSSRWSTHYKLKQLLTNNWKWQSHLRSPAVGRLPLHQWN